MGERFDPHPFTEQDLQIDRLTPGVDHTLQQFYKWQDRNQGAVEDYMAICQEQVAMLRSENSRGARLGRRVKPLGRRDFKKNHMVRELEVFGIRHLAETPERTKLVRLYDKAISHKKSLEAIADSTGDVAGVLEQQFSIPRDSAETRTVEQRLTRLYQILPDKVVQKGGMGKVVRTMFGVGAIAAYDMFDAPPEEKRERIAQVVNGALVYGSVYAIVDDTLQDMQGSFISARDRARIHEKILEGLRTGGPIDATALPDDPLTYEMNILYEMMREYYPIENYQHLYHAAESMYITQDRDARVTMEDARRRPLTQLYPDIFIKAGMSRVVANIIGRKTLDPDFYSRCLNSMLVNQLRDDLSDRREDNKEKRVTPFTRPFNHGDSNPLYDMFSYNAYVAETVHPGAHALLAYSQVSLLSSYLPLHPDFSRELLNTYCDQDSESLSRLILMISGLPAATARRIIPIDRRIISQIGQSTMHRDQTTVDPQTFVLDRVEYTNEIIRQHLQRQEAENPENELNDIARYALEGGGKRIRPALTLMLAEGINVDPSTITPLILGSELFHTASLLFDDLPWQDNSDTRHGKPAAHTVYEASSVELTGVSMLLNGISQLQSLTNHYSAESVSEVTTYIADTIQKMCWGQNMDLSMNRSNDKTFEIKDILRMYHLKTAVAFEASLIPLMMLEKKPQTEIELVKRYAHHAGMVFQIRDDLLDAIGDAVELGKGVQQDTEKVNVVRQFSSKLAQELIEDNLEKAVECCRHLPFNTNLLEGVVKYFARRRK